MCMIGTLEADDSESRINTNSMVCNISCSLAKECKRLCEDEIRINGVKSHRKLKKIKTIKIVKKIYHLQDKDDIEIAEIKKKLLDLRKEIEMVFHSCTILDVP